MTSHELFQKAENLFKASSLCEDSDKSAQLYEAGNTIRQTALWMEKMENQEAEIAELEQTAEWLQIEKDHAEELRQQEELRHGG